MHFDHHAFVLIVLLSVTGIGATVEQAESTVTRRDSSGTIIIESSSSRVEFTVLPPAQSM